MRKVLVTSRSFGKISNQAETMLAQAGYETTYMLEYEKEKFESAIVDYDALIIGAHPFPAELLKRCPKLKIICKHGVGLDNIPVDACKELGVCVTNAPGTNSNAVADFAVMLMMASTRRMALVMAAMESSPKNRVPKIWPPGMLANTCGSTLNPRPKVLVPAAATTPSRATAAGMIIMPARPTSATSLAALAVK